MEDFLSSFYYIHPDIVKKSEPGNTLSKKFILKVLTEKKGGLHLFLQVFWYKLVFCIIYHFLKSEAMNKKALSIDVQSEDNLINWETDIPSATN